MGNLTDPLFGPNGTTQETKLRTGLAGADWVPSPLLDDKPRLKDLISWWNTKYDAMQKEFSGTAPTKDKFLDGLLGDALHQTSNANRNLTSLERTKEIVTALTELDAEVAKAGSSLSPAAAETFSDLRDASFVLGMTVIASYDKSQGTDLGERERSTIAVTRTTFAQDVCRSLAARCGEAPPKAQPSSNDTVTNYSSNALASNEVNLSIKSDDLSQEAKDWVRATGVTQTTTGFDLRETMAKLTSDLVKSEGSKSGRGDAMVRLGACGQAVRAAIDATVAADAAKGQLTTYFPDTTKALAAGMVFNEVMRLPLGATRGAGEVLKSPLPPSLFTDAASKRAPAEVKDERDHPKERRSEASTSSRSGGGRLR